jgi:2-dehydro-3-deoxyglucarate aldolase
LGAIADYFTGVNEQIAVVVQIESPAGVAAAGDIATVDGVDALFIGPSDLAAGMGHFGRPDHAEVQAAIAAVVAVATRAGKAVGILAPIEADAHRYLGQGVNMVAVGSDLGLLRGKSAALAQQFSLPPHGQAR